jgi:5'-nucleotidase
MAYDIDGKLVVAVASSALFDLAQPDQVFRSSGEDAYRSHQREHEHEPLPAGVAYPFVKRLLSLNGKDPSDRPVEVVLLSRNDPDTGMRVMRSIEALGLDITRAVFTSGRAPWPFLPSFNASLFLTAVHEDVREALELGHPAGCVLHSAVHDDTDPELRIAFDFDGVLADDEAERVFQEEGLERFQENEKARASQALHPGPLKRLLEGLAAVQNIEKERCRQDPAYRPRLRTAIVTARSAPALERVVTTLRCWDLRVDQSFFLGGMDKRRILDVWRPHIFFDDQMAHAVPASASTPSVHVPFGIAGRKIPAAE